MAAPRFKSGFVSIIGRPNVGKSTLLNLYANEKVSIVSPKPQTTRNKIRGILTRGDVQIIFIDTPGIHRPATKLGGYMVKSAEDALREVDAALFLVEPSARVHPDNLSVIERFKRVDYPVFLVVNKTDTAEKPKLLSVIDAYRALFEFKEIFPISALKADNTAPLLDALARLMPEGPMYFPDDMVTDQPERQIMAELIREKALTLLSEEVPHGLAVEVTAFKPREGRELIDAEAVIYCEKDSHKGIVIGKRGEMLKRVGAAARRDAEALFGSPIYLQLWVKVKPRWRDNDMLLRHLGYDVKNI